MHVVNGFATLIYVGCSVNNKHTVNTLYIMLILRCMSKCVAFHREICCFDCLVCFGLQAYTPIMLFRDWVCLHNLYKLNNHDTVKKNKNKVFSLRKFDLYMFLINFLAK